MIITRSRKAPSCTFVSVLGILAVLALGEVRGANWPAWRGVGGSGISSEAGLPVAWTSTQNIRWKADLSSPGNSSPIVWNDKVFLTQASQGENRRGLICFSRKSGTILWNSSADYDEADESHQANPQCSSSPVTDGERVIAWYGSAGVYAYDMAGKELWHKDLGKQKHSWGYASSPVIDGNLCFLNFGPGTRQFLIALDKTSGKTVWEYSIPQTDPTVKRTDGFAGQEARAVSGSWSTPIIVPANGHKELVLSAPARVQAFDPASGKELWHCEGLNPLLYTSAIYGDGVIVAMGGYMGPSFAVRPGGSGDVTQTHRIWYKARTKNRIGSGIIFNGHVFVLNTPGTAECIDLKTGETVWEERAAGTGTSSESWSSMILAGDNIYIPNQSGDTIVLKASPQFQIVSANSVGGELCNSSLAVSDGEIFLRTHKHLWCIANPAHKTELR